MPIFGDLIGRLFQSRTPPEPAIAGPILGKRKASGSSDQSRKRNRRESGYSETDYANVDLDAGILGRAGPERLEFTPRKVRRIKQATGTRRTSGENSKSEYIAASEALTAGSIRTSPRVKKGSKPTTPKEPSYAPTSPRYGPSTPKMGISMPKYLPFTPSYTPKKLTYRPTSSRILDSGLGDDVTGLGITSMEYGASPTPYRSPRYNILQQKPHSYIPGSNDFKWHTSPDYSSDVSYPELDTQDLGTQSIPYPFTAKDQEILDVGNAIPEDEYPGDDMELDDDDESEIEIIPIMSKSPSSKIKGKTTSTRSPVIIKSQLVDDNDVTEVNDDNESEIEVRPITTKITPSKGMGKATPTKSPVIMEPREELANKATTSTRVTTPTRPATSPKATAPDPWISSKTSPNTMASEILLSKKNDVFIAKTAIRHSLIKGDHKAEPEYAFRDVEIRDGLWWVMDLMERFTTKYFKDEVTKDGVKKEVCTIKSTDLTNIFRLMKPETVKVIECVASGGPSGEEGWQDLFTSDQKRRALINAIVGNVLTEQVFQHACFGSSADTQNALKQREKELKSEDGFLRNKAYGKIINGLKVGNNKDDTSFYLPLHFDVHTKAVVAAILEHLYPIMKVKRIDQSPVATSLYEIVSTAGVLSLLMRADEHTVYYFVPTFKEDIFTSKHMECFNRIDMQDTHPRNRKTWPEGTTTKEKNRASGDDALTQITIMDGVTAYRQGGWETGVSTPMNPQWSTEGGGKDSGIRCRVLTQGWVYCRWGRARNFGKNGVAADDPKAHGQSWKGDGFVEFKDVKGVPKATEKPTSNPSETANTTTKTTAQARAAFSLPALAMTAASGSGIAVTGTDKPKSKSQKRLLSKARSRSRENIPR